MSENAFRVKCVMFNLKSRQTLACCLCLSSSSSCFRLSSLANKRSAGLSFMATTSAAETRNGNAFLKVALCQFLVTEDKNTNLSTCSRYIESAAKSGAGLIVLPEIWNSPYATAAFPDYAEDLSKRGICDDSSPSTNLLRRSAIEHKVWIVGGSIPEVDKTDSNKKLYYNTCQVFNPNGEIVAKHRKAHLFDINVPNGIRFMESETLTAGCSVTSFASPWGHIGIGICYDIRFPEYALALRQYHGCRILIFPGAFNMTTGPAHWELLQRARAVDTQCFVLTASPARSAPAEVTSSSSSSTNKYPHYSAWGHSTAVSPWGDIIATRDETAGIVFADLDLNKIDEMRQAIPTQQQKRSDLYSLVVNVDGSQ